MAVRSTWETSSASSSASSLGTWLEVRAALLGHGCQVQEDAFGAGNCGSSFWGGAWIKGLGSRINLFFIYMSTL